MMAYQVIFAKGQNVQKHTVSVRNRAKDFGARSVRFVKGFWVDTETGVVYSEASYIATFEHKSDAVNFLYQVALNEYAQISAILYQVGFEAELRASAGHTETIGVMVVAHPRLLPEINPFGYTVVNKDAGFTFVNVPYYGG